MATTLEQLAGKATAPRPQLPLCPKCDGEGFTGCPAAITATGTLIVMAWRKGVACVCPAGQEFARQQLEWLGLEGERQ